MAEAKSFFLKKFNGKDALDLNGDEHTISMDLVTRGTDSGGDDLYSPL